MALVTVEGKGSVPSLGLAAEQLGVRVDDLDADFGVVPVDAANGLYSVRVRADRLPKRFADRQPYQGPFSDVPIVPFGPVEDKSKE